MYVTSLVVMRRLAAQRAWMAYDHVHAPNITPEEEQARRHEMSTIFQTGECCPFHPDEEAWGASAAERQEGLPRRWR